MFGGIPLTKGIDRCEVILFKINKERNKQSLFNLPFVKRENGFIGR